MRTPVLANKPTILIFVYCYGTSTASPICKMGQEEQREHGTKGICWHIVFGTLHISDARKGQVPRAHILHGITKKKTSNRSARKHLRYTNSTCECAFETLDFFGFFIEILLKSASQFPGIHKKNVVLRQQKGNSQTSLLPLKT